MQPTTKGIVDDEIAIAWANYDPNEEMTSACHRLGREPLELLIGDKLSIKASDGHDWAFGHKLDNPNRPGLFPLAFVRHLPRCSSEPSEADQLAGELAMVLLDWWHTLKATFSVQNLLESADKVTGFMDELLSARKRIVTGNVPLEELRRLRLQLASKMDMGNAFLGHDMVIRDAKGQPLNALNSLIDAFREHQATTGRIFADSKPAEIAKTPSVFSLLLHLQTVMMEPKSDCEFIFSLYDDNSKCISEYFVVPWSPSSALPRHTRCLFTDLGESESTSRLLLVVHAVRVAPIEAISTLRKGTLNETVPSSPGLPSCRQPFAIGLHELSIHQLHSTSSFHEQLPIIIVFNREDTLDNLLSRALSSKTPQKINWEPSNVKNQMLLNLHVIPGAAKQAMKTQLSTHHPPTVIRKMSFPDVLSADETRNEMYITLASADLSHGMRHAEKNIEARLRIVDGDGRILPNCIERLMPNGPVHSTVYNSLVFYKDDKPRWNEIIKIVLPLVLSKDFHIRIALYHRRSEKQKADKGPFALAFARLMEGARLLADGQHELLVYRLENGVKLDDHDISYCSLPSSRDDLRMSRAQTRPQTETFACVEKNSLAICTLTCSTTLTQNVQLLDILRWSSQTNIRDRLEAITRPNGISGEELVKFIPQFCDALFAIADASTEYDRLVFDALVMVIRRLDEQKYHNFRPVLDQYVKSFHSATAYKKLLPILKQYIESADRTHEKTQETLKALGYLGQLIVQSKECQRRLSYSLDDEESFRLMLNELLNALLLLIAPSKPTQVMTCQNIALKHLPSLIPHLIRSDICNVMDMTQFLVRLLDECSACSHIIPSLRLNFMQNLIRTQLFDYRQCRIQLMKKIIEKIVSELEQCRVESLSIINENRNRIVAKNERISLCATILSDLLVRCAEDGEGENDDDEQRLIVFCLRPVVQTMVAEMSSADDLRAQLWSLVLAMLARIQPVTYKQYMSSCILTLDKMDILIELLHVFRDLLQHNPFRKDWFLMISLQNKALLKSFKLIMTTMKELETNNGDSDVSSIGQSVSLWREYFLAMVAFVSQSDLQLERFSMAKRDRFLLEYGDLRQSAAADIRSMWFFLPVLWKMNFVPSLVGQFLQVSLIADEVVRETTMPILFDMTNCEFYSRVSGGGLKRHFELFADEMLLQLDSLVDDDRGDRAYGQLLKQTLLARCSSNSAPDEVFNERIKKFVEQLDRLLTLLFDYRQIRQSAECVEMGMGCTFELLNFYKDIGQHDLYVRYIYKLHALHEQCGNRIEAAYTLRKHFNSLRWTSEHLGDALINAQLNRQCFQMGKLKEELCMEMATLFDAGEMWEAAIDILKQLQPVYEKQLFDYVKLAELLDRLALLYRKIDGQDRAESEYFLVGFYGLGFPHHLNDRQFVFKGAAYERLQGFTDRMLSTFTGSRAIGTMDDQSHLVNMAGRHLQIISVKPLASRSNKMTNKEKTVNRRILWYHRYNEVDRFKYHKTDLRRETKWTKLDENSEAMRVWLLKKTVHTAEKLPNMLQWSRVVHQEAIEEITPLDNAVTTMQEKNEQLLELAQLVQNNPMEPVMPLGGHIRGVLQANVGGGTENYKVFFGEACTAICSPSEKEQVAKLGELIAEQVPIVEFCLYVHASRAGQIDAVFHDSLCVSFEDYRRQVETRFGKRPSRLPRGASIHSLIESSRRTSTGLEPSPSTLSLPGGRKAFVAAAVLRGPFQSMGIRTSKQQRQPSSQSSLLEQRVSTTSDRSFEDVQHPSEHHRLTTGDVQLSSNSSIDSSHPSIVTLRHPESRTLTLPPRTSTFHMQRLNDRP